MKKLIIKLLNFLTQKPKMICDECNGDGVVYNLETESTWPYTFCEKCNGSGYIRDY